MEGYDGGAIDVGHGVVLDPADNPELEECVGDTIITTDGRTLLGADDKSGIAAIMGALEILVQEPEIPRPTIRVCFNPDEEIGRGADRFPMERFDCPVAFTIDGSFTGEVNVETFSADKAVITFTGVSVHPGTARGKMVNALTWMGKLLDRLPMGEAPECTDGREGFYHPVVASGDAASCTLQLILRDFDTEVLEERGRRLERMCAGLMAEEPHLDVKVEITKQYRNMYDVLSGYPEVAGRWRRRCVPPGSSPGWSPSAGGRTAPGSPSSGCPPPTSSPGASTSTGRRSGSPPACWPSRRARS